MCPAGEGTGRGPRSPLSALRGGAGGAPGRTPAPGGSALAEDGGAEAEAGPSRQGREGRGERGSARGGAPDPGEGLGRRRGGCSPAEGPGRVGAPPPSRGRSQRPGAALGTSAAAETQGGSEGGRAGEGSPAYSHPGSPSASGAVPFRPQLYVLLPLPFPQISLMRSSLLSRCCCSGPPRRRRQWEGGGINPSSRASPDKPPAPLRVTKGEFSPEI